MVGTTSFPSSVDDFATTSPGNLSDDDSTGRKHSERHDDMEAAMEVVQTHLLAISTRTTASITTASLASLAAESGTVTLAKGYRLLQLQTDRPARVRLYTTAAKRDADAARALGANPTAGDHGLMLEVVTATGVLTLDLSPTVDGFNGDTTPSSTVYYAVTNLDTATGTVTVTLTWVRTE